MSYHAGIGPQLAAMMGVSADGPRITCNGCGMVYRLREDRLPPQWFLDGKAPPGWATTESKGKRDDRCKRCR